jgi:hypothetical protein
MRGVAWALDLPRDDPSKGDHTKLATRDDGGDANRVEPTMSELAGEGAAVILAALDPVSAERAARWGEKNGVAVIVLAVPKTSAKSPSGLASPPLARTPLAQAEDGGAPPPPQPQPQPVQPAPAPALDWAFVAGVERGAEISVLGEELVSRAAVKIVPIVPSSSSAGSDAVLALAQGTVELQPTVACDTAAAQSGEAHFPVDDWKTNHLKAWLVDAPSECARDLLRGLDLGGVTGTVALTLDAAGTTAQAPGVKVLAARAGEIPVTATTPDTISDPDVRAWLVREGAPPNWWASLGHDAAVLARRAVAALPLDATTDPKEVAVRRLAAKVALTSAQAHLWTSDSQGFSAAHVLGRELKVVEMPGLAPRPPFKSNP